MADVVVYSRPGCMFCHQVEDLLRDAGVRFRAVEVVARYEQESLMSRFDARSFPVVLVDGAYLGGFTHVVKLHAEGKLQAIGGDSEEAPPRSSARRETQQPAPVRESQSRINTLAELAKLGEYLHKPKSGGER